MATAWNKDLINILNDILARIHGNSTTISEVKEELEDIKKNNEDVKKNN